MGFSRKEYWSGLPRPPPRDIPDRGMEPASPVTVIYNQKHKLLLPHERKNQWHAGNSGTDRIKFKMISNIHMGLNSSQGVGQRCSFEAQKYRGNSWGQETVKSSRKERGSEKESWVRIQDEEDGKWQWKIKGSLALRSTWYIHWVIILVQSTIYIITYGASQLALVVKNPPANAGDVRDIGSIPG